MAAPIHLLFPREAYLRLLERCAPGTEIYEYLVNGAIERDATGETRVRIFCDELRELKIYQFIETTLPDLPFDRLVFQNGARWWSED